jgi:hypothetical protein
VRGKLQVSPVYDTVLAMSITKWVHLNWGDSGLKRFFRRVFRHLKPGGHFLLEPQEFSTYRKRSKIAVKKEIHRPSGIARICFLVSARDQPALQRDSTETRSISRLFNQGRWFRRL